MRAFLIVASVVFINIAVYMFCFWTIKEDYKIKPYEVIEYENCINQTYWDYMGREPTELEKEIYILSMDRGTECNQIRKDVIKEPERAETISYYYQDILGRPALQREIKWHNEHGTPFYRLLPWLIEVKNK